MKRNNETRVASSLFFFLRSSLIIRAFSYAYIHIFHLFYKGGQVNKQTGWQIDWLAKRSAKKRDLKVSLSVFQFLYRKERRRAKLRTRNFNLHKRVLSEWNEAMNQSNKLVFPSHTVCSYLRFLFFRLHIFLLFYKGRQAGRQTNKQIGPQVDWLADGLTRRQIDLQTDRQANKQIDK